MQTRLRVVGRRRSMTDDRYQELRKEWLLFGIVIWSVVLDSEEVPLFVILSNACFGDTGGWVSKFAPFDSNGVKT